MSNELETAGLASAGGLSPGGRADLSGQPCRNCGESVEQRHCPRCGQLAASYHRPFFALIAESISDSMALDGRVARTLPLLLFRPGVLTKRYVSGRRARYVPPFRLFLLSSLLFYFVSFAFLEQADWLRIGASLDRAPTLSIEERSELEELGILRKNAARTPAAPADVTAQENSQNQTEQLGAIERPVPAVENEAEEHIRRVTQNPRLFLATVKTWAPRLSLLFVPLTMLVLALMYFWRRRVYVYDHAIHALHLHSWIYLVATSAIGLGAFIGAGEAALVFLLILPVYVFFSLRAAYGSGIVSSLARTLLLGLFWWVAMVVLVAGVVLASVLEM